ncbi:MAG: hypothetical protein V2I40_14110 [Desulfobacteraceae bacterium]|jgi:hypothetical protein|nr:hypothetical protein [Desulfobacteraceae bacterium]
MKVAFVHYHLKTGGVGTVIQQQAAALHGVCSILVLTGDRAGADMPCAVVEIPELGYDRRETVPPDPNHVAEKMLQAISDAWPGGCDILHIHNPTLAKNRQYLQIIKRLQRTGINLLLQLHDLAEDGRPDAYFDESYPADCHYGVINKRDARILEAAGLKRTGLHHLPNAVRGFPSASVRTPASHILYPVRAIRRKNLGEAFLLSLMFNQGERLVVTQPPNSPADLASYRDWIGWAREASLHVDFEAGRKVNFAALVGRSRSVLTTSVAEGFGLAFLEPWTAGKLLWGRKLADICTDFEENGICLGSLYDRLDIPLSWIDVDGFARDWHAAVDRASARYGHAIAKEAATNAFTRMTAGNRVDFGLLSEKFQRQVLARLTALPAQKRELVGLNPWLANPGMVSDSGALIASNRQAVRRQYSLKRYRSRLLEIYQQVDRHAVHHRIDKRALHDAFFDLDRFSLLKWGPYES